MITAQHPEWPGFKRKLEERIEQARDALEDPVPETVTAELRGRIKELRGIIEMIEPKGIDAPQPTFNSPR